MLQEPECCRSRNISYTEVIIIKRKCHITLVEPVLVGALPLVEIYNTLRLKRISEVQVMVKKLKMSKFMTLHHTNDRAMTIYQCFLVNSWARHDLFQHPLPLQKKANVIKLLNELGSGGKSLLKALVLQDNKHLSHSHKIGHPLLTFLYFTPFASY